MKYKLKLNDGTILDINSPKVDNTDDDINDFMELIEKIHGKNIVDNLDDWWIDDQP